MTATAAARRLDIRRTVLRNGIAVIGLENHAHASVVVRLCLRAAPVLDPPERAGLAALAASGLLRGTTTRSFAAINETVDAAGMSLHSGAGRHTTSVSARCLADDFALATELMADVVRNPTFPEEEIAQLRGQVLTGLKQADDNPAAVADRYFRELSYPAGHPYRLRTHGYQETVATLTRDDLAAFHSQWYGPHGAFCVVVGDVEFDRAVRQLDAVLGDWQNGTPVPPDVPDAPPPAPVEREYVLPGKTQSDLVLGRPSIRRKDPAYYALRMANLILGRLGMFGRLGESVRETRGLAYGVHSELEASLGPGPWCIRAGVNPANIDAALAAIKDELERIRQEGITEDELERGQRYTTGSLALHLETNDGIAGALQEIELFDLGLDYLDRYPQIIASLTKQEVDEAAARLLPSFEETVRVVAGPARA